MTEIELKLQIPAGASAAVERFVVSAPSVRTRLQAIYFDTPDRRLAAAGVALRLRKEGRRWVQTLKCGPAHGMARGEHNVVLAPAAGLQPALDPARHAGTPLHEALLAALKAPDGDPAPRLVALYRTDIRRRHRLLRSRRGTVELALDRGEIVAAGPDGIERRWPVDELEVELKSGSAQAVIDVARRQVRLHGLWLDTRTKAERGDRLARGLEPGAAVPAVKAAALTWRKGMRPDEAWAATLHNALAHALPNWSELAGGGTSPEQVHQLRVALRRLRSAERFFAGWPGVRAVPWGEGVAALFRVLGATRDRDVLAGGLQREIDAALAAFGGMARPSAVAEPPPWTDANLHDPGVVLLEVLAYAIAEPGAVAEVEADRGLVALASERLQDWHARVRRDAKRFDDLPDADRHRLRKRLKRLRYAAEFSAGLFPKRAVERYLAALRVAQERLGEFNDVCVALEAYRPLADTDPRAWFALGWLAQRREATLQASSAELRRLRKAEPFWA